MQQSASGRVAVDGATAFDNAANAAGQDGKGSTEAAQLARDADTFQQMYLDNPSGPNNVNLYPTPAVVKDCAKVSVTVPLIPNGVIATVPPSTSTVPPVTPEEQFANDAVAQIPTVANAVNAGTLTTSEIGSYGDNICNLMPQYLNTYGPGPSAFNEIANEFSEGATQFTITGSDDGAWVSLAINDICPTYSGDIPYGATG